MNLRSTSGLDIESISAGKGARSSSSSAAGRKSAKTKTSPKQKNTGRISKIAFDKQGRPLTISHDEAVAADMKHNAKFASAMLCEGVAALFDNELAVGKHILRNYVNGTIGFEKLAKKAKIPVKSLMRMLGPSGNPQMSNLFTVIGALQAHAGIELHIAAE